MSDVIPKLVYVPTPSGSKEAKVSQLDVVMLPLQHFLI